MNAIIYIYSSLFHAILKTTYHTLYLCLLHVFKILNNVWLMSTNIHVQRRDVQSRDYGRKTDGNSYSPILLGVRLGVPGSALPGVKMVCFLTKKGYHNT